MLRTLIQHVADRKLLNCLSRIQRAMEAEYACRTDVLDDFGVDEKLLAVLNKNAAF